MVITCTVFIVKNFNPCNIHVEMDIRIVKLSQVDQLFKVIPTFGRVLSAFGVSTIQPAEPLTILYLVHVFDLKPFSETTPVL